MRFYRPDNLVDIHLVRTESKANFLETSRTKRIGREICRGYDRPQPLGPIDFHMQGICELHANPLLYELPQLVRVRATRSRPTYQPQPLPFGKVGPRFIADECADRYAPPLTVGEKAYYLFLNVNRLVQDVHASSTSA